MISPGRDPVKNPVHEEGRALKFRNVKIPIPRGDDEHDNNMFAFSGRQLRTRNE